MKTFKDYLESVETPPLDENILQDVLNLGSRFMYFWKNLWIINTKHGGERIGERNQLTKDQMKVLFKRALDKLANLKIALNKEILFFSRSLNQGFVSVVVPEGLKLITFLPKGKQFPKPGTDKMIIEAENGKQIEVDEIIEID